MTSNDNEILVAIYENQVYLLNELQAMKTEQQAMKTEQKSQREELAQIRAEQQSVRQELRAVHEEQRVLAVRMDDLQTSVYWFLGAVGIFIAAMTIPAVISSMVSAFRRPQPERPDNIDSMVNAFLKVLAAGREQRE